MRLPGMRRALTPAWIAERGAAVLARAVLLTVNALQGARLMPMVARWALLRAWGVPLATHRISEGCWFGGRDVRIGAETFVNFGCVFDNSGPVVIGARCDLGMNVMLVTSTHELGSSTRRAGSVGGAPVVIGDGCWIGAGAVILPGVTIGSGCVIGSGAVVTKDCQPDGLYAGNPARRIRELD